MLSDGRFAADVIVERTRCRQKHVAPTQDVAPGDRILFSGFDGIMPKGTPLGTVLSVDRPREGLFLKIQVVSVVRFDAVEEVLVILSRPTVPLGAAIPGRPVWR